MTESTHQGACEPQNCHRKFSASRGGHAPGHLRDVLIEALEAPLSDRRPWWRHLDMQFVDPIRQRWWDTADAKKRGRWLLGQLWNCTDIVPSDVCSIAELPPGSTYAQLVRRLSGEVT